jgi:hypothetical protein
MQSGKLDGGVKSIQKTCFETIKGKTRTINKQIETVKVETSGNIASMWVSIRIRHLRWRLRLRLCDLHTASFYANVSDLWLFLFDSRNYYMDCIRMDENHILYAKEKLSAAEIDSRVRIIFLVGFLLPFYMFVCFVMFLFRNVLFPGYKDYDAVAPRTRKRNHSNPQLI